MIRFQQSAKALRRKEKMKENEIGEIIVDAALRNMHHEGHKKRTNQPQSAPRTQRKTNRR